VLRLKSNENILYAELPKVKSFLDSIGRNSKKSKKAYFAGLRHLHHYITEIYPEYN